MRLWPLRRRSVAAPLSPDDLLLSDELVQRSIEDAFVVEERRVRGNALGFHGRLLQPPDRALSLLEARLRPYGLTPFLRRDGDRVVLQVLPLGEARPPGRVTVNIVLFVLTCVSVLVAGAGFAGSPTFDAFRTSISGTLFLSGIPFAATILTILTVHEFGHYFTARYYRTPVSLPYFIPAPPPLFPAGTLGAIISMRSPARNRNSLFDIAAAGPLSGLAVALGAMLLGLAWSRVTPIPLAGYTVFGDSLLSRLLVVWKFGPIPDGMMVFTHPVADAAWFGLLVTAINLFPVGQLDGGRIAYALFGRHHRVVGKVTVGLLLLAGTATAGVALMTGGSVVSSLHWFVWAGLIYFLIGFNHSPPVDDVTPLSTGRRVLAAVCLVLVILLVPPVPIETS